MYSTSYVLVYILVHMCLIPSDWISDGVEVERHLLVELCEVHEMHVRRHHRPAAAAAALEGLQLLLLLPQSDDAAAAAAAAPKVFLPWLWRPPLSRHLGNAEHDKFGLESELLKRER